MSKYIITETHRGALFDTGFEWQVLVDISTNKGTTTATFEKHPIRKKGYRRQATELEAVMFERYMQLDGNVKTISFNVGMDYGYSAWVDSDEECEIVDAYADDDMYAYNFMTVYDSVTVFAITYDSNCHYFEIRRQNCVNNKKKVWRKVDSEFRDFCMLLGSMYNGLQWVYEENF